MQVIYIILIIVVIYIIYKWLYSNNIEGFAQPDIYGNRNNALTIYDTFYSGIYDQIFYNKYKTEYEVAKIEKIALKRIPYKQVNILDAGCGTGRHIEILSKKYKITGVDISNAMILKTKKINTAKNTLFIKGDFNDTDLFKPATFTHITCLFFTIYYSKDIKHVLTNFHTWLKQDGIVILHVVDQSKFDPVLERMSSLIPLFNPQKNAQNRHTETVLKFNTFTYNANWDFNQHDSLTHFVESFSFKNKQTRQHIHTFHMIPISRIELIANKVGFSILDKIELKNANHEHNYLLFLHKI